MDEHVSGTMLTSGGLKATCRCGWKSEEIWENDDEGHEAAHAAGHDHIADATGSAPPGRRQGETQ